METVLFSPSHAEPFLRAAQAEGWITGPGEINFFLQSHPEGCLASLSDGQLSGFITAIRYSRSAWIGNLLVLPEFRCQGIGRGLMQRALHALDHSGCETVWLTASADGAHLYRTLGFRQIDTVQRWRGSGATAIRGGDLGYTAAVATIDCMGWGDCRHRIFEALPEKSSSITADGGFLVYSPCADVQLIGPWGVLSGDSAAVLLDAALGGKGPEREILLDVPENNHAAGEILQSRGFRSSGNTLLMCRGKEPEYRPEYIYSLASMGSYG